jgi:hypothetical protein
MWRYLLKSTSVRRYVILYHDKCFDGNYIWFKDSGECFEILDRR